MRVKDNINISSAINNAIADGKTTVAEKNAVDSAFSTFNTMMGAFQSALEDANKTIQVKLDAISKRYVDDIEIGGVNHYGINSPLAANVNNPPYPSLPVTKTQTGFDFTGVQTYTSNVRIGKVITSNGWWTVSFDMQSNGVNSPMKVDICDKGAKIFNLAPISYEKAHVELSVYVDNYGDGAVYNFVDIDEVPWVHLYVTNLNIEKGNKATGYKPAPEDVEAKIEEAAYLKNALKKSTEIEGGLVLASVIAARDSGGIVRSYQNGDPLLNNIAFAAGVTNFGKTNEKQKKLR